MRIFSLFIIVLLLFISRLEEKAWPFIWWKLNPFTKEFFVPCLFEIGSVILEDKIFWMSSKYFAILLFSPFWTKAWPIIWTNLNFLYRRMLVVKFRWNWLFCTLEILNFRQSYFAIFLLFPPFTLEKDDDLHLNKPKSSSPNDALC